MTPEIDPSTAIEAREKSRALMVEMRQLGRDQRRSKSRLDFTFPLCANRKPAKVCDKSSSSNSPSFSLSLLLRNSSKI
jgi:hypothetical protein